MCDRDNFIKKDHFILWRQKCIFFGSKQLGWRVVVGAGLEDEMQDKCIAIGEGRAGIQHGACGRQQSVPDVVNRSEEEEKRSLPNSAAITEFL